MSEPLFFPIRHLSPSGAWHLVQFLEKVQPDIVLVEGPSDAKEEINDLVDKRVEPPIALLGYTTTLPVRSIMYPLASYSPEYQAIKWAKQNKKEVRFIDLPTSVLLALEEIHENKIKEKLEQQEQQENQDTEQEVSEEDFKLNGEVGSEDKTRDIEEEICQAAGDLDFETFWERNFEHNMNEDAYRLSMLAFGEEIRKATEKKELDDVRNVVREGFMKHQIQKAYEEGYSYDKMVVITGAYHTSNLRNENCLALTEKEIGALPQSKTNLTLMPYSYYLLSSRSGYGAGNKSPYYFEMMWQLMNENRLSEMPQYYMTSIVSELRKEGHIKSSAEVIEAVRLAIGLAKMHEGSVPTLADLRDGVKTCLGEGNFSKVVAAIASVEIGTKIGHLPDGMSKTALQNNFNYMLKDLKLEKYKSVVAEDITLDLRENRRVKTEKAAFLDLERSYFLHQLQVLGVSFSKIKHNSQEGANWKEEWTLCWRPETEIELVESALYGDTVKMAAAYILKKKLDYCNEVEKAAALMASCYECGLSEMIEYAMRILQSLSVETQAFEQITEAAFNLSSIIRFGSIRRIDISLVEPLLAQLFERSVLLMLPSSNCDHKAAIIMADAIEKLDKMASFHDELVDMDVYLKELITLSNSDDKNPRLSGMACSILLERNMISKELLNKEISRRLLPGIPADIGSGWFEGLASRNRYVILANLTIWEKLDEYIVSLTEEELRPAIVFLHRTFSDFTANEKYMIVENLANLWGLDQDDLSEYLNQTLSEDEEKMIEDLQDFDF